MSMQPGHFVETGATYDGLQQQIELEYGMSGRLYPKRSPEFNSTGSLHLPGLMACQPRPVVTFGIDSYTSLTESPGLIMVEGSQRGQVETVGVEETLYAAKTIIVKDYLNGLNYGHMLDVAGDAGHAHLPEGVNSLHPASSTLGRRAEGFHPFHLSRLVRGIFSTFAPQRPPGTPGNTGRDIRNTDKAVEFPEGGSALRPAMYGQQHASIHFLEDIAWSYFNVGRNDEALGVYQTLVDIGLRTGKPLTENLYRLSKTLEAMGHTDRALSTFQQTWQRFKAEGCKETTLGSHALKSMGIILANKHQYSRAIDLYKQALALEVVELGPEYPEIANTLANLGASYGGLRRYRKCVYFNQLALGLIRRTGKINNEQLADIHHNIAVALAGKGKEWFAGARRHFARSHHLYFGIFGAEHIKTKREASLLYSATRAAVQLSSREVVVRRRSSRRNRTGP